MFPPYKDPTEMWFRVGHGIRDSGIRCPYYGFEVFEVGCSVWTSQGRRQGASCKHRKTSHSEQWAK